MTEERFDRIDARLDGIDARLDSVDTRLDGVDARLDGIDARLGGIDATLASHTTRFDALEQRVGVLHEDVIARLAGASERKAVTADQFAAGIAEIKEELGRRLDPLEATVRAHSQDIAELKRRR